MSFPRDDARRIVELLGLEPIPVEGGLFRRTWHQMAVDAQPGDRPVGTAIYAALSDAPDGFSALHRLGEVEVWHFYTGDPAEMLLLHADGTIENVVFGPDIVNGHRPQVIVPAGTWMGARLADGGTFALFGTTMAPGFTPESFDTGDRDALVAGWPDAAAAITTLTRPGAPTEMPPENPDGTFT